MLKYISIIIICLTNWTLFNCKTFAQENNNNIFKHQIGINASDFVNMIFKSQTNSFDINYSFALSKKNLLRTSLNFYQITTEDGYIDAGTRIGYQRIFLNRKRWLYYYSIDFMASYLYYKSDKKETLKFGIITSFGISFKISNNFFLTTEPNFYWIYNIFNDYDTFSDDNSKKWFEKGIDNVGHIQLTFIF